MEIRKDPGRIITFYSYKGGTGRSMAVANVAWLLAAAGRKVLMVDWDLEAPGLHRYVHPFLDDPDLVSSEGVIDFVISYTEEASGKKLDEILDPKWFAPYANITRFAAPLDYDFRSGGTLDFIPAGKQGPAYAGRVNSFNWRDFYVKLGGRAVIEEARTRMRERYEFILIDSRTGVSDTSGICTVQLPDDVVICFTLNMQSVTGAAAAARSMQDQRPTDPLHLFPVAMRVEFAEKIKTDAVREYAKGKFLDLMSDATVPREARDGYWHDVEVPQIAFYAFEEQMAFFLDPPNQRRGVLGSTKELVWHLTKVDVRNAPGPDPEIRNRILATYAGVWSAPLQIAPPEVSQQFVYVSYNEYSIPAPRSATPTSWTAIGLPVDAVPAGVEVVTAADLPRTGSWMEAFRGVLRRSVAMFLVVDEHGVSPIQHRELIVALDHRLRVGNSAFPITAVPLSGSSVRQFPGLASPNGESCPYPGLRPFNTEDAAVFFGHEAFLEKLAEQMLTAPVIVLNGKPRTGKTSAIKAGLIPKLLLQDAPHPIWKVAVCTLSDEPLACIAEALVRARGIAQFESQVQQETSEVVARLRKEGTGVFKEVIASVLSTWPTANRIAVVIEAGGLRLDSQNLKSTFRDTPGVSFVIITEAPDAAQIALPALSKDDLIRAIEKPVLLAGCSVDAGLAARIAADLEGQEDSLALLQFCMTRLWKRRVDRVIRAADYEAMGGVQGAVAKWAEGILSTLSPREQELAVRVLCQMVGISDENTYQPRQLRSDLIPEPNREIVMKLVAAGLLVAEPTGTPNVSSYSLFHLPLALRFPRLKTGLAQNADFLRWREAFQSAVEEYSLRQSYSALLRGDALATAQKWRTSRPDEFTPREVGFINRSEEEARRTDATMHKRRPRTAILAAGLVLAFVVALVLAFRPPRPESASTLVGVAYQSRQQNNLQGAIADLTQSLTLRPDPKLASQIYSDRAYCYKLAGNWDKSIADLTDALAAQPAVADKVRLLNDRAFAYIQVRRPEAALADYAAVLSLDPKDSVAASNREWLMKMLTPTKGGTPTFFVIMRPIKSWAEIPPAVIKLVTTKTISFLNVKGWGNPIPESEVRYNDPRYELLARRIVGELATGGLIVKGPFSTPSAASPRIELWLATTFQESQSTAAPSRSLTTTQ